MAGNSPRVGVLALQGDVREHLRVLADLGAEARPVRRASELAEVDGLVLPGGESSVIDKLARAFGLFDPIRAAVADGLPVLGTCAGLILLADRIDGAIEGQRTFGGLDVRVQRNAFGSQTQSFETDLAVPVLGDPPVHAVFIRAPVVTETGPDATPLAALPDGRVVAVEQGALLGLAFHPESTGETRFHARFLDRVHSRTGGRAPAL
ncbi:MAG: glutamine amidotransferase subunit PdxT [Microbacterium sp. 71-36]|uniref:pyridoxal 5'-phosphate synthase glutaminase subunit PdxT n=1 Tax=unclassified Microbacterium TaxID=2609290 RepID=UPI000869E07E|nr:MULTISPECIES: pyridoxal 5'-phosphate synthase glutaminase subunit PdxT [unclassified Microbacterium]MBN9210658.1 pyridoxal 5'-phosphate synthase glutaminase subunit PdxT [Microbacterium sp.]ODT39054.1 MAG: glutamine amidotransferase subunit PdxT [Microbacterium sp. SCN 71-17]ODU52867.1 MAG: glutamine amidotransferase subunit PdxT [Microbacterium sp. SCN 70-10]OJV76941.1 MAG: glutamine amidotransferase subunit PdxT [Microbacterium sp. 71-36]